MKTLTRYQEELSSHVGYLMAYGNFHFNDVLYVACDRSRDGNVSADTLRALLNGEHISLEKYQALAPVLTLGNAVERAELDIRFSEAYLGRRTYAIRSSLQAEFEPGSRSSRFHELVDFVAQIRDDMASHWLTSTRLSPVLRETVDEMNTSLAAMVCDEVGRSSVKVVFGHGCIRPAEFSAVLTRLAPYEIRSRHLKALYAERFLGKAILLDLTPADLTDPLEPAEGRFPDPNVKVRKRRFSSVQHPRLIDWLIARYLRLY
jgi:hypothetical protein